VTTILSFATKIVIIYFQISSTESRNKRMFVVGVKCMSSRGRAITFDQPRFGTNLLPCTRPKHGIYDKSFFNIVK